MSSDRQQELLGHVKEGLKNVELRPHQKRVREGIRDAPGKIVYHGLGTGKTIGSIGAAEEVGQPATVVAPAGVRSQFEEEIERTVGDEGVGGEKPDVRSFYELSRGDVDPDDVVIFDEAHRLRNVDSSRTQKARELSEEAQKRLLLTGTPIYNDPSDLAALANLAAGEKRLPEDPGEFKDEFVQGEQKTPGIFGRLAGVESGEVPEIKNEDKLRDSITDLIDYEPARGEDFPDVKVNKKKVEMSPEQSEVYKTLMGEAPFWARFKVRHNLPPNKKEKDRLNAFLSATRQASNSPHPFSRSMTPDEGAQKSPKVQKMAEDIEKNLNEDENFKSIAYSNFVDSGLEPLARELDRRNIDYHRFTGELSDDQRETVKREFNEGEVPVLLASSAGAEGLDTKGTKKVQIMEPHWNESKVKQVIGRAVRSGSHDHLPEDEREVEVDRYHSTPKPSIYDKVKSFFGGSEPTSTDEYLYDRAQEKQELMDDFLEVAQQAGQTNAEKSAMVDGFKNALKKHK